ncbi:pilus assembly protein PilP [Malikia granosa]|uniref:Pilus assembly protein PilP n=1 Tax=Malikia granosa TaxID=263067 RepID=A0A2S9K943_9BURK|nr:pilus assembly protein PilP [Malikia granosa]PRD66895.1 pilus assembly protein PilP [Malikia granosa]
MKPIHPVPLGSALGLVLLLAACGQTAQDEIRQWMAEQRQAVSPQVEPIPEPTRFVPQAYGSESVLPPFSAEKLFVALRSESASGAGSALIRAELNRRKEPLEFIPLDAMSMVGLLDRRGRRVALVRVDKLLYQVGVGQYLGQNFGRVMKISEHEIALREIVQDAAGDWVERPVTLQLQEETRK